MDTAITTVLNRYLLTALGMNPDPLDAANKCRHLVAALPREWMQPGNNAAVKTDLAREATRFNRTWEMFFCDESGLTLSCISPEDMFKSSVERPLTYRLSGYLMQLGGKGSGGRDCAQDMVNLLKFLGFVEESEKLRRQRLK